MLEYKDLISHVLYTGRHSKDRTGVGTIRTFGEKLQFDLRNGFPAVTIKKLHFGSVAAELSAFLKGANTVKEFHDEGTHIWDLNAQSAYTKGITNDPNDLGPIYGAQWRNWRTDFGGIDQLRRAIDLINKEPTSRRIMVSAWNVSDLDKMALPPCHTHFQFFVEDRYLDCLFYMRSVDVFLGMPFDIASYALLTHIIANETGLIPRKLIGMFGDTHIYLNHTDQIRTMLRREPYSLPALTLDPQATIDNFNKNMATLINYTYYEEIRGPLNV